VDGVDAIGDILQGHILAGEDMGDVEQAIVPTNGAVATDPAKLEVSWVLEVGKPRGEDPGGGVIVVGRDIQAQGFVGAFNVIDGTEAVEGALLSAERGGGRTSGFGLEGAMEAFMTAVLLGTSGLDQLSPNA